MPSTLGMNIQDDKTVFIEHLKYQRAFAYTISFDPEKNSELGKAGISSTKLV